MRFSPVAIGLSLMLATLSSSGFTQKPDSQIDARSAALTTQADTARVAGKLSIAQDLYETALAVDPRNRGAFIGLAEVARKQQLPGKAIRLYFESLAIEPNDPVALGGQGEAMVEKGAVERAKLNLARVRSLCKVECKPATELASAIAKGPPPAVMTAQANTVVPPKGDEDAKSKP
ncbi:MAG: tetratricopeptide repeat protein [Sphingomonadaceae bacterium]